MSLIPLVQISQATSTLVRPMIESLVRGVWLLRRYPLDEEEIKELTTNEDYWKHPDRALQKLIDYVGDKSKNGSTMETIKYFWETRRQFFHDCVHGNNRYLNLYIDKETNKLRSNVSEDLIMNILLSSNLMSFVAFVHMKGQESFHKDDPSFFKSAREAFSEYLKYTNLLRMRRRNSPPSQSTPAPLSI